MFGGLLVVVTGVITLATHRVRPPWMRGRVSWRAYGCSQICLGSSVLIGTAPRVAGASAGWTFLLSGIALLPLLAGVACLSRAQPSRSWG